MICLRVPQYFANGLVRCCSMEMNRVCLCVCGNALRLDLSTIEHSPQFNYNCPWHLTRIVI